MPSQSPKRDREAERRLNIGTVAIASAASAAAALIVSQFSIAGTWIAAAVTPVLVAVLAEVISRPTEKIKGALTTDATAVFPAGEDPAPRPGDRPERDPAAPRPGGAPREPVPMPGADAPIRIYRAGAGEGTPRRSRRKVAVGAVLATAAIAFVIGGLILTVPELIAGQSIGQADRGSTFLGGKARKHRSSETQDQSTVTVTTPGETVEQTVPEDQPTTTETTPTETAPPAAPAPAQEPQATTPQTTTPTP